MINTIKLGYAAMGIVLIWGWGILFAGVTLGLFPAFISSDMRYESFISLIFIVKRTYLPLYDRFSLPFEERGMSKNE